LQQPPLHGVCEPPPHDAVQIEVDLSHAVFGGQSLVAWQPQVPVCAMQTCPLVLAEQSVQLPEAPQALFAVPGEQAPLAVQQPAGHGAFGTEHANAQIPFLVSHPELVAGQLAFEVQPHWVPAGVVVHTLPVAPLAKPAVQLAQAPPAVPQAATLVPAMQVPPAGAEQHPPLHGWEELHVIVHVPCTVSQAVPMGQSEALLQPHLLVLVLDASGTQAEPAALPTQEAHIFCPVWQAAGVVPRSHVLVPGAQQPPLQAVSPTSLQDRPQLPLLVLHD
jgi:hypothetical protein